MKLIKKIIAYINWQQYAVGTDDQYTLPKTLCSTFWATLFGVIAIPFSWPGNLWNLILHEFKIGYQNSTKVNMFISAMVHALILAGAMAGDSILFDEFGINLLTMDGYNTTPILFYFAALGVGIISWAIVGLAGTVLVGLIFGIIRIFQYFGEQADDDDTVIGKVTETVSAVKNKYCPMIDWSDVDDKEVKMYDL